MITIFTALYPEAKELIRALSLKKDMTQNHFQVFSDENNQIQIVITGASAIAAATAVAEDFLINYGSCAGRKNIPVGTVSLCNKLTQTVDGRTFYPDILYRHPFEEAELYSFPAVQDRESFQQFLDKDAGAGDRRKEILVDMEAAAISGRKLLLCTAPDAVSQGSNRSWNNTGAAECREWRTFFTDHGPGSRRGFNIYPAAFDNAGKKQQAGEYAGSI